MSKPRRDPALTNRPGAVRVPMHPWEDPANRHRPVTREELLKVIATLDLACKERHRHTTIEARLRRFGTWLTTWPSRKAK